MRFPKNQIAAAPTAMMIIMSATLPTTIHIRLPMPPPLLSELPLIVVGVVIVVNVVVVEGGGVGGGGVAFGSARKIENKSVLILWVLSNCG